MESLALPKRVNKSTPNFLIAVQQSCKSLIQKPFDWQDFFPAFHNLHTTSGIGDFLCDNTLTLQTESPSVDDVRGWVLRRPVRVAVFPVS
jgi:hypothetical protein